MDDYDKKLLNTDYVKILIDVMEINFAIVRQNSLIVHALTLPQLFVKGRTLDD